MMYFFRIFVSFLSILTLTLIAIPSSAVSKNTDQDNDFFLDDIIVTATRDDRDVRKVPANVTVVTPEDIEKSGAVSITDVLNGLSGIHTASYSGNGSQAIIDIRGFGAEAGFLRHVVLLDGRRLNRPDMASPNWLDIPLSQIERIEIVRGPAGVLYGDAAIAGVVNIITKRGEGKPKGELSVMSGSYNTYDTRLGVRGASDKLYYTLNGEFLRSSGYRDRSHFTAGSAGGSIGYNLTESVDISLGVTYNETDNDFPGALTKDQLTADRTQARYPNDDAEASFFDADFLIETILGDFGRLDANLIFGKRIVESNYASFFSYTDIDIDTIGATPRYILDRKIFGFDNKLTVGFDIYQDELTKDTFTDRSRTFRTHEAQLKRETMGLYVHNEFNVMPDLILAVGARTERAEVTGSETDLSTGSAVFNGEKIHHGTAWEASMTYLLGDNSKIWGKYAAIYRFPSLDQQASYYAYSSDSFLTNLEKEKGKSYEAGIQISLLQGLKLGVTGYLIDMEDEISYNPVTYYNENLDRTRHRGIEFSIAWQVRNAFLISANYTIQEAVFRNGPNKDRDVPLVPNHMANGTVEINLPWSLALRPEIHYMGSQYFGSDNDNSSERLDSHTLVNLALHWQPDRKVLGFMTPSAYIRVDNLFDKHYVSVGYETYSGLSYYPAPTINFRGGISFAF